jgi:hypothetical protein
VTASGEAAQTGAAGGAADSSVPLFAAGPADQVVTELRAKGFDARVVGKHVEVRGATRAEVERALSRHRTGRVKIVIVP